MIKSAIRAFDAMTPLRLPNHPGTTRIIVDTGAGMWSPEGKWLPSWFKEGWNGPKEKVDRELLKYTIDHLPPDSIWSLNIREGQYDIRTKSDDEVERTVDFLRDEILIPVKNFRPDIQRGFYGSINPEQYGITMYHKALLVKERVERGEPIADGPWWIANLPDFKRAYEAWVRSCHRLTYGFDTIGGEKKLNTGGGLIDALDVLNPSNYVTDDLNDGPDDPIDIESDTLFISEQNRMAVDVADHRRVIPFQSPYRKNTAHAVKQARLANAVRVARDNGAHGVAMWYYDGVAELNPVEKNALETVKRIYRS